MKQFVVMALMGWAPIGAFAHSEWQIVHLQNDQWIQETFRRSADGWQDRVSQKIFSYNSVMQETDIALGSGRELRGLASELWEGKEKWSVQWEETFSKWVSEETDADFFRKYQVATDCADVLYALRWIFARINGLEMAVRLTGSGDFLTHRSVRSAWSGLPTASEWYNDKRFLASLNYLLNNTYTHSLMKDSYPIKVDRQAIRPGVYHLDLHDSSGHTQIVYKMDDSEETVLPFIIYQSTTPRLVRELMVDGFWYPTLPKMGRGGLLRMRWPDFSSAKVNLIPEDKMPYYSLEQYSETFIRPGQTYNQEVYLRLNSKLNMTEVVIEGYKSLQAMFQARVSVVEQGYQVCQQSSCPEGSAEYDAWSTPSRDKKVIQLANQLIQIESLMGIGGPSVELEKDRNFFILDGSAYNLRHLLNIWRAGAYSSDPRMSIHIRWGISGLAASEWLESVFTIYGALRQQELSQKKDPLESDLKFGSANLLFFTYCNHSPSLDCERFQTQVQSRQVTLGKVSLKLNEALQRIPFMVSSGEVSFERQWGQHSSSYRWVKLDHGKNTLQGDGYYLNVQGSKWNLWQQNSVGGTLLLSGVNSMVGLLNHGPFLITYDQGKIWAYSLNDGSRVQASVPFSPNKMTSYGNGFLIFNNVTNEFSLGYLHQGQIHWLDQGIAKWLPSNALSESEDNFTKKAFIYGTSAGSRIWDFSGSTPKSYVGSIQGPVDININTEQMMVVLGAGIVLKESGTFIGSSDAQRIIFCHPSGQSCFIFNSNGTYEFAVVSPDGQFLVRDVFSGSIYFSRDQTALYFRSKAGELQIFDWEPSNLREQHLLSDESEFLSGNSGLVSTKIKSGGVRVRKGNQELLRLSFASIYLNGQRYAESFDPVSGRLWIFDMQNSGALIANPLNRFGGYYGAAPNSGAVVGASIWLQ